MNKLPKRKAGMQMQVPDNYKGLKNLDVNECIILSFLPTRWRYIARDGDGELYLFSCKPVKIERFDPYFRTGHTWGIDPRKNKTNRHMTEFPYRNLFKCVDWRDKEATSIDALLKNNIDI